MFGDGLVLLADFNAPNLAHCLDHALTGPPSGTMSAALNVINRKSLAHCWSAKRVGGFYWLQITALENENQVCECR